MRIAELELDLDVFAGPFDLLLSLILREDVDLLEVELADIEADFDGKGYGDLKTAVGDEVAEWLTPVRERYHKLRSDEAALEERLAQAAERARALAAPVLADVRDAMGVGPVRRPT